MSKVKYTIGKETYEILNCNDDYSQAFEKYLGALTDPLYPKEKIRELEDKVLELGEKKAEETKKMLGQWRI